MQLFCSVCMFCRANPSLGELYQFQVWEKSIRESDYGHNEDLLFNPALSLVKHILQIICLISATVSQ